MVDDGMVRVRGARVHNLRGVAVAVPRGAVVAFTGVSGSGKSSLAFGTLFAEAQHRYLESVSPYARRLLRQVEAPQVDSVTGMPPAVALEQRRSVPSSRSSVGTISTMSNLLRMLLSRCGSYPPGASRLDSDAFSPNTPAGACPECHGQGVLHRVTEASLVPDPSLSIREGAVASWPGAWQGKNLRDILGTMGHDLDRPWRELPAADREWILFTDEQPVVTVHPEREPGRIQRPYQGKYSSARRLVLKAFSESRSEAARAKAAGFLEQAPCPLCGGRRLRPEALAVTFAGLPITELAGLPADRLAEVLRPFTADEGPAGLITADLTDRLAALRRLGLGYLSLDRAAPTLSTGELQRLRLATQLRSGLFGVVYVLDEPSAGLHPADTEALREVLAELRAAGNSVFVVEHDMTVVGGADWLVDVGPGAGAGGGRVLYSGPVDGLRAVQDSATRRFLFDPPAPPASRGRTPSGVLRLRGVTRHNLRGVDVDVPLGVLTAVTGVSGAGKSTLLGAAAEAAADDPSVGRVVTVDQTPLGRTPRSNLATYTGLLDTVRKLFAGTDEARRRGYGAGRFSFNVASGRCPTCEGAGAIEVELLFLPTAWNPCPDCHGSRYNPQTLEITYRDATIADVLARTVDEAAPFLADVPAAARVLTVLQQVGLGYLRLGQPAPELSGGEAQRVKLAAELHHARRHHTLYLLDEPTTGLHPADSEVLTAQLHRLVDAGATVLLAEHHLPLVASADHLIDLGPAGGTAGGRVLATGTPATVAATPGSPTAPYLAAHLGTD
ncbi:ATP-binding cassette domain-containing protein [Kitasatospora cheerisanensis]|uniref:UvrABC system protein A n=1 Tax=Kitasatospora cheerisanensis KCTC 2395 TaxID=1348663 RepID=A0A066YMV4_9ACTN|nr:excinuclease ABC subunit UvrA [Kitasatospora cheerisanensis]KDN81234.1 excinuclease ABC subunit A [Kitasatospora cheerisanensis KCTC 2395]